ASTSFTLESAKSGFFGACRAAPDADCCGIDFGAAGAVAGFARAAEATAVAAAAGLTAVVFAAGRCAPAEVMPVRDCGGDEVAVTGRGAAADREATGSGAGPRAAGGTAGDAGVAAAGAAGEAFFETGCSAAFTGWARAERAVAATGAAPRVLAGAPPGG